MERQMPGSTPPIPYMKPDQFMAWEPGDDRFYELLDGQATVRPFNSSAHGIIAVNLCTAFQGVRHLVEMRGVMEARGPLPIPGRDSVRFPDLMIRTGIVNKGDAGSPAVAIEVLSAEDGADAMAARRQDYALCGVEQVIEVSQERACVWIYRVDGPDQWRARVVAGLDAQFILEGFGLTVRLADIYENVLDGNIMDAPADA
ncbi:Uma2 family endonuclease [Niveispirillum sp. KHB5.9]|uniref:Uma2 family endonuclease n=1 Tax=Niveispirillum sp. KHB5.9 TaxID=3400269 RepID=UPI003A87C837